MQPIRTTIDAWSREDLVQAILMMMRIAGWSLASVWTAYFVRFASFLDPVRTFLFGKETADQVFAAKAAWGQFGDFVGGTLNPMVSLLTLVGLLFTILLQHEAMMRVQSDALANQKALSDQARLSLDAARLQSLSAALAVFTEMHRQAVEANDMSAFDLLKDKEGLAGQILDINKRLASEANATNAQAETSAA